MGLNLVAVERHLKPKRRERGTYRHFSRHRALAHTRFPTCCYPCPTCPLPRRPMPLSGVVRQHRGPIRFQPMPKKAAVRLWHRARDKLCDLAMGLFQLRRCSTFSSRQSHVKS
jgi:hypothetical protein